VTSSLTGVDTVRQNSAFTSDGRTRMCYASCCTKTLMQSSKQISVWVTSNKVMKCELPCISSRTTATGTEGKQHVAVFDVCVRISRSFCHSWVLLCNVWVHVTTRFVVMTALLGSVLPHLAATCVSTDSCSRVIRCITFSTNFCCNEGIALWRGCVPVSVHPVQHRSQYCHEEPSRLLHGQNQMWWR
jgi:hypothetical protein